jgi:hypothetical protein
VFWDVILCKLLAFLNVLFRLIGSNLLKMVVGIEDWARARAPQGKEEDTTDAEREKK